MKLFKIKKCIDNFRKISFNSSHLDQKILIKNNFLEIGEEIRDSCQPIVALESII